MAVATCGVGTRPGGALLLPIGQGCRWGLWRAVFGTPIDGLHFRSRGRQDSDRVAWCPDQVKLLPPNANDDRSDRGEARYRAPTAVACLGAA
jgi:hypothetical protein